MNIKGAVAIVTGSGTGVGAACIRQFAAKGAHVCVNYSRSRQEAEEVVAECLAMGAEVELVEADVSDDASCRRMVDTVVKRWGRLDILVNNAAITKKSNALDLETLSAQDFEDVFAVNVIGVYQMVRAAVPAMRASGGGAIVNVSSVTAFSGAGTSIAYTASKGALNSLTLAFARSQGPDIRVNAVCPGIIDTRWMRNAVGEENYPALEKQVRDGTPLGRVATPDDIASAIVWLADGADFVTGELLTVDGGLWRLLSASRPRRPV
jgi:NAD(P)-dependent dehydrogenase (short-subunit alcohol dehydrogenase family)